nr:unnamed protein product [Callosobruchus chinensis]
MVNCTTGHRKPRRI